MTIPRPPLGDVTIPIRDGITEGGLIIISILAVVLAALVIVALALWRFGASIAARMKAVQDQVANDHKKPDGEPLLLRDDLDEKHDENARKLDRALHLLGTVQRDVAFLMRRAIEQEDRIDDIENTITPKEKP